MSLGKPVVKDCFMDDEMKDFAISEAMKALETSNSEKVRIGTLIICKIVGSIIHEVYFSKEI